MAPRFHSGNLKFSPNSCIIVFISGLSIGVRLEGEKLREVRGRGFKDGPSIAFTRSSIILPIVPGARTIATGKKTNSEHPAQACFFCELPDPSFVWNEYTTTPSTTYLPQPLAMLCCVLSVYIGFPMPHLVLVANLRSGQKQRTELRYRKTDDWPFPLLFLHRVHAVHGSVALRGWKLKAFRTPKDTSAGSRA